MTVPSATSKTSLAGTGSLFAFPFPYYFLADSHLLVTVRTDSTGAEATQTLTTDYTVAGAGVAAGGTVTMVTAPAVGETLVVSRNTVPVTQGTDFVENDPSSAEVIEQALDKLTMITQKHEDELSRCVKASETVTDATSIAFVEDATGRANNLIAFDASGNLTFVGPITGSLGGTVTSVATGGGLTGGPITSSGTVSIADDGVTLAKMAAGTAGNLITYDAAGDPAAVITGTAGQFLGSNGAGAAPTMQTLSGHVKQIQTATLSAVSSAFPGNETWTDTGLTVDITPSAADSTILVQAMLSVGGSTTNRVGFRLVRDSTAVGIGDAAGTRSRSAVGVFVNQAGALVPVSLAFEDSPATTSATTYKVQIFVEGGAVNFYVNRSSTDTDNVDYHRGISTIIATEILA